MLRSEQRNSSPNSSDSSKTLLKLIQHSASSGRLNLSSHGLSRLPNELWNFQLQIVVDHSFERAEQQSGWWEVSALQRLTAADNQIESIDPRINEMSSLCALDVI